MLWPNKCFLDPPKVERWHLHTTLVSIPNNNAVNRHPLYVHMGVMNMYGILIDKDFMILFS